MEALTTELLDFGALGIFVGFLIWQHVKMEKRVDKMRDRYDVVQSEVVDKLDEVLQEIKELPRG